MQSSRVLPGDARLVKNQEYRDTPSIQCYAILEQEFIGATVFERLGEDWMGHVLGADEVLTMPEIGIEMPLRELCEGVDFAAAGGVLNGRRNPTCLARASCATC